MADSRTIACKIRLQVTDIAEQIDRVPPAEQAGTWLRQPVDWPTLGVGIAVYSSFGWLTWMHHALPWWIILPLAAYLIALHGSLQHEAVHGYPFRRRFWNTAFVFPSLWLWLPYTHYRETHLRHHRDDRLTSPASDPESNYLSPADWERMGPLHRVCRRALTTVAGRMVLGPPYFAVSVWLNALWKLRHGDSQQTRHWLVHVPAVAIVVIWVVGVCGIPLWQYVLLYVWPGVSLTVLRSYLEHQGRDAVGHRTVIVQSGPVMSFMYLNNNLHALHHLEPATVWHQRPRRFRVRRNEIYALNNGYRYGSYGDIVWHHLFRAKEPVVHPLGDV